MSTELINCITVKKDGVYVSSHSSNDTFPYHSWRCRGLSEIYDAEGQKGLDREVIRMLYEYAELRGTHKSLARYRYAKDDPAAHAIYQKYMDKIDDRYGQMDEADQNSVWYKPTERQGSTEPMSGTCGARCIPKSLKDAGNTTRSRKTEICLKGQTLIQNKPSISEGCFSASLEKGLFCGLSWISFLFMICSGF